jgi:glycosyltransferase involved in cell wall biosynthesis
MFNRKICFIANSGFTIVNFRSELIKILIENGCNVTVICPSECELMVDRDLNLELEDLGVEYIPVEFNRNSVNPISEIYFLMSFYFILRKMRPDVVLNYTIKPTIYGSIAAKLSGVKCILSNITGLGYIFTANTFKSRVLLSIVKLQYKIALRCNSLVFFQNPDDEALFRSLALINGVKTKVINGSGIDTDKFVRQSHNQKLFSFIFVGRLLRDKGVNEFIQAAELLKKKYPDAIFTLLGPIDDNPSSLSKHDLERFMSSGVVSYLPLRSNVRDVLEEYEVFVLPSYREGTPRSTLEAMSMSMPVITTNVPGCRETVISGSNGFLVEAKNVNDLAAAMEKFIVNRHLVRLFGDASRVLVCNRYDVIKVNESITSEFM